jgi:hypothetical protein
VRGGVYEPRGSERDESGMGKGSGASPWGLVLPHDPRGSGKTQVWAETEDPREQACYSAVCEGLVLVCGTKQICSHLFKHWCLKGEYEVDSYGPLQ